MHRKFPVFGAFPLKPALTITLTICCYAGLAQAQSGSQPWQGTFVTVAPHVLTSVAVDLPAPPAGKQLTIEQISVVVGPLSNLYGKFHSCAIESSLSHHEDAEASTRIQLPAFSLVGGMMRTWALHTPLKLHFGPSRSGLLQISRPALRVRCSVEAMVPGDKLTVTAVGYTSPL